MAGNKSSFGLDGAAAGKIDWDIATKRILHDARSDFIYAPHLNFIYSEAGDALAAKVMAELKSGTYTPSLPITLEVPKTSRMRVGTTKRPGPSFSRPGSILLPKDRLLYQALADQAAPIINDKTDHERSFSHKLAAPDSDTMFMSTRTCWNALQKSISKHSENDKFKYVVKVDISNCFGSLNQHTLINILSDCGYPGELGNPLESMLLKYTGDRSSRGILQGIYPSDLFGNFYLHPIDRFFADRGVPSSRYVDDMYIHVESVEAADQILRDLIPVLRNYDLSLNEGKSFVAAKAALVTEEPDLEALFDAAIEEVSEQLEEEDFDVDYGFQSDFDDTSENSGDDVDQDDDDNAANNDLDLKATQILFESISDYPGNEENIERFCIPLFAQAGSKFAVTHVIESFDKRPTLAQIYSTYLVKFIDDQTIREFLLGILTDESLFDWQKMWVLAALLRHDQYDDAGVKVAWDLFRDANRHEALRAVAAVFVGRFGDHARRLSLINAYGGAGSPYIQSAIYYASRWFPGAERANAIATWGNLNELNQLMTVALTKKKAA